jgi:hypothetical protein
MTLKANKRLAILDAFFCVTNLVAYNFGEPMTIGLVAAAACGAASLGHFCFYLKDRKRI